MNRFRAVLLSSPLLLLLSPSSPAGIAPNDAALILDTLLDLNSAAHQTPDERGEPVLNPLRAYQEWAALYEKYAQRDREDAQFSEEDLRIYLLLGWVAREKLDAGTMEAFASDMMILYEKHGDRMLRVLRDAPFLVPSTCRYLSRHFGFEDKNREKKPGFLATNTEKIKNALAAEDAKRCLELFAE